MWGWLKGAKKLSGVAPTQYDQYFEEAAKKEGLDAKWLKAVTGAESSFNKNAVGPKTPQGQAQGLMQVMPFNFQPGEDPFNARDNIMAGARVMAWAKRQAGGDFDEMLRWYNGGKNRGSKENNEYPGRVKEQYAAIYGTQPNPVYTTSPETSEIARNTARTNQLLQQSIDNSRNSGGNGVIVYNNTGGNAVVTGAQLGAR